MTNRYLSLGIIDKCAQNTHTLARSLSLRLSLSDPNTKQAIALSAHSREHTHTHTMSIDNGTGTYFRNWHGYANSGIFFMISTSLKLSGKLRVMTPDTFSPTAVGVISHQYSNSFLTSSLWEGEMERKKKKKKEKKNQQKHNFLAKCTHGNQLQSFHVDAKIRNAEIGSKIFTSRSSAQRKHFPFRERNK